MSAKTNVIVETKPAMAEQLADYIINLRYEDLTDEMIGRAKMAVLDQIGCELIGSTLEWNQAAHGFVHDSGGQPESTIAGDATKVPAHNAAFVNAGFGHGAELDDYGSGSGAHSGSVVVPTALALAEKNRQTGREMLAAVAIGYDVALGLGNLMRLALHHRGYHTHAVISVFCATAVAGRLLNLTPEQLSHALAIAGSHAAGTMEYDQSGGEVKRIHSGIAVQGGIESAELARRGLTGPLTIFEGSRGIFRVLAGIEEPETLKLKLEPGAGIMHNSFKQFPTTASQHAPIGLLADLMAEHGLRPDDVKRIDIEMDSLLILHVGTIYEPHEAIEAQFSLPFSLAIRLVKGANDLADYTDPHVWADPRILEAAHKVFMQPDPTTGGEKYSYKMRIEVVGGRTFQADARYPKGHYTNPFTKHDLHEKFYQLGASVLPRANLEKIVALVDNLEDVGDVSQLASLLVP